jgi:hypothetical protein
MDWCGVYPGRFMRSFKVSGSRFMVAVAKPLIFGCTFSEICGISERLYCSQIPRISLIMQKAHQIPTLNLEL